MKTFDQNLSNNRVLVIGNSYLTASVSINFAKAGFPVSVVSNTLMVKERILIHLEDIKKTGKEECKPSIRYIQEIPDKEPFFLAILTDNDTETYHKDTINRIENNTNEDLIIGICTNYIPLSRFQHDTKYPGNILGMNWTEPAHTNFFLELVANTKTHHSVVDFLEKFAIRYLGKDPYIITGETGVRSKMLAAMAREAFFLIEKGYAKVEDIDRACRNDAGTYMPFAGNFRYMDVMGTYAYGVVMKKLNKELSNATKLPDFFVEKLQKKKYGMKVKEGFYKYDKNDIRKWNQKTRKFSYEIKELMEKYPFEDWLEEVKESAKSSTVPR